MPRVTLAKALETHRAQEGASFRSYESYRKDAHESGFLLIGGRKIRAEKVGRAWTVDADEFAAGVASAVALHRAEQEAMQQAEQDYIARKLNSDGARLPWGSYSVHGQFHFISSDYARITKQSSGGWVCNSCWQPASMENNREECHTCRDWNGCGTDCTLSRVFCVPCGTSLDR
ncbi:MAG: hypothetical protein QM756_16435 [Polyangiaceae bacterium]